MHYSIPVFLGYEPNIQWIFVELNLIDTLTPLTWCLMSALASDVSNDIGI